MTDLIGNRFLTLNTVIRVGQIEVTRDRSEGDDESSQHTVDYVKSFRDAIAGSWPEGRITWAFSWLALQDKRQNYRDIRDLVVSYHHQYGDDITFFPGGYFANAYNTREQVNRDLHDALEMASAMVGGTYRPSSVVAGFLSSENQRYLAEHEDIHVCQGNIWSQYSIDNQDGDGSISYPFYPSKEHFCKPAQNDADFIDCVNLDGWTCDFLAARREGFADGFCSRFGVGPIETIGVYGPEIGVKQMLHSAGVHFDEGFDLNGFAWVTCCWEVCLVHRIGHIDCLGKLLEQIRRRWSETQLITLGEFGLIWRQYYKNNHSLDYRFKQRGSGIGGSDADKEIEWFMNSDFRLALLRNWKENGPAMVIDFTRYDIPAEEPQGLTRKWSLMGQINQKQTRPQDMPVPLKRLDATDLDRILRRYPEISRWIK